MQKGRKVKVGVKIVLDHPDAKVPVYAKLGDAGADVYAVSQKNEERFLGNYKVADSEEYLSYTPGAYLIRPNQTVMISLGFRIELPDGWEMQVRSRSGLAKRGIIVANAPGTIDCGFRSTVMVLLRNTTGETCQVLPGTRVAQFVLKEAPQAVFEQTLVLSDSDRGTGGFGSTGTR